MNQPAFSVSLKRTGMLNGLNVNFFPLGVIYVYIALFSSSAEAQKLKMSSFLAQ